MIEMHAVIMCAICQRTEDLGPGLTIGQARQYAARLRWHYQYLDRRLDDVCDECWTRRAGPRRRLT